MDKSEAKAYRLYGLVTNRKRIVRLRSDKANRIDLSEQTINKLTIYDNSDTSSAHYKHTRSSRENLIFSI